MPLTYDRYWIHTDPRTVAVRITRTGDQHRADCSTCGWWRTHITDSAAASAAARHLRATHA